MPNQPHRNACFISLGKIGDIVATLPILHDEYIRTGQKPLVITSQQYVHLFDRVPFVETELHDGDWMDLSGAWLAAKRRFNKVISLAVFGRNFPIQHKTSSFQLEAYERAGLLKQWDSLKLAGLNPGPSMLFTRPTILYADHSESSPFLQKEQLYSLLKESFPNHDIVRLSMTRVKHFFDYVEWYDAAEALVTVDTAHLHLSAATKTPVVALAQDRPHRWHGSAWSKRFAFYCRYHEFDGRRDELVERLRDAMAGKPQPEVVELN